MVLRGKNFGVSTILPGEFSGRRTTVLTFMKARLSKGMAGTLRCTIDLIKMERLLPIAVRPIVAAGTLFTGTLFTGTLLG
jgi:hypothetical protein